MTVAAFMAGGSSPAFAADWPVFKPGQWQFDRTIESKGAKPQKISKTECIDPTADQKAQRDMLKQAGCEVSPPTRNGTTYSYSTTCQVKGKTTASQSVLDATTAEAYTLTVQTATDKARFREVLNAKRIGDCSK
jgi:hypothetical protein